MARFGIADLLAPNRPLNTTAANAANS